MAHLYTNENFPQPAVSELRRLEQRLKALQNTLPDEISKTDRSCGGTVEQCVPLGGSPLLQISPPPARRPRRSKP